MKIHCQRENLLQRIQTVSKAISPKNTLPILGGVLMIAKENGLTLRATDLDIAIECLVPADVVEAGALVIADGRRFLALVQQLPEDVIEISQINDYDANVVYAASSFHIRGLEQEQFPVLPGLEGEQQGSIAGAAFAKLVRQIGIAAATEESRPLLTGILLDIKETELVMVATDSHRLTYGKCQWQADFTTQVVIPAKTMLEVARLAAAEETVEVTISKHHVCFRMGSTIFISRTINGTYPDYQPLLPKESSFSTWLTLEKKGFQNALSRANLLSTDHNHVVTLDIQPGQMILSANSAEIGNIREVLSVQQTGEPLKVGYNARYLLDALKVMESEQICFKLTGDASPGILIPEEGEDYLYLLLPVRIRTYAS